MVSPGADPRVSVLVTCYNYGHYLRPCLESVLQKQESVDLEVVLIDDASTDETPAVAREFDDTRLRYVRHERNVGHVASSNEAIRLSRGCYLANLDADDCYLPGHLSRALAVLDRDPRVGMVHAHSLMIDQDGRLLDSPPPRTPGTRNELAELVWENHVFPPSWVVRRAAWEEVGLGYDPKTTYSCDWWVWLRLAAQGWPFHYLAETAACFRLHGASLRMRQHKADLSAPSEMYILDRFFSLPGLPAEIVGRRNAIYAHRLRRHADLYFSGRRMDQCRRSLWAAARLDPGTVIEARFWWRWVASWIKDREPAGQPQAESEQTVFPQRRQ